MLGGKRLTGETEGVRKPWGRVGGTVEMGEGVLLPWDPEKKEKFTNSSREAYKARATEQWTVELRV